ncbi:hypothetical protein LB503_003435 [Fusarium chuoi]|nr:hypothetical protein LB503_003435 [Fusarium chuoi]
MAIIAVAGGAGKLGRAIVEAIVEQGQHTVVVLAREAKDAPGAKVIAVDYTNADELAATLEANNIETVCDRVEGLKRGFSLKAIKVKNTKKIYIGKILIAFIIT